MRHVSVRRVFLTVALCLLAPFARAGEPAWDEVVERAAGQAVFWNAWGGDERINAYIAWIGRRQRLVNADIPAPPPRSPSRWSPYRRFLGR